MTSEAEECADFVRWLRSVRPDALFCHVPNGGFRRGTCARSLSLLGVRAGVPDYLIFEPGPWGIGIAIEMKRSKEHDKRNRSRPTRAQIAWIEQLRTRGWWARVCYGAEDARLALSGIGFTC